MRQTYLSLQYLRAFAALLVVLAHTTEYPFGAGQAVPGWTARTGDLGVLTFFVISGFIISIVAGPGRFDPISFAWKRFLRVVPLYWLGTGLLFALTLMAPSLFKTTTASSSHVLQSLLFIPHPAPGDGTNFWSPLLKPGWTLNFEVFFYALTVSLFWCRSAGLRAFLLALILGGLAAAKLIAPSLPGVLEFYASTNLIAFVSGIALAQVSLHVRPESLRSRRLAGAISSAACLSIVWIYAIPEQAAVAPTLIAATALIASGLLIERAGLLPGLPWLRAIGDASYSLYLTHMFSVGLAWTVMRKFATFESPGAISIGVAISMVGAILVSLVSYRLFERPLIGLSQRRFVPRDGGSARQPASTTAV